jgi:hypothetical protein
LCLFRGTIHRRFIHCVSVLQMCLLHIPDVLSNCCHSYLFFNILPHPPLDRWAPSTKTSASG